jgi:hypothetical protein
VAETKYEGGRFSGANGGKGRVFLSFVMASVKGRVFASISSEVLASLRENSSKCFCAILALDLIIYVRKIY